MSVFESNKVETAKFNASLDTVTIRQYNGGLTGGRALDYTGFTDDVIKAGHVIVKKTVEDEVVYSPLGVENGAYKALADGESYAGVVVATKNNGEAVAIMDNGRVNDEAVPYPITDAMKTAIKAVLPQLIFEHD
jgi:hypothetical protein